MDTRSYNESSNDMAVESQAGHYRPDLQRNYPINHSEDHSDGPSDHTEQSRYLDNLARGRAARFYVNGDVFEPSKKIVYNPKHFRDFGHYMDYLTEKLEPKFGAVRKICTPHHGHRIRELRDLQENGIYIVAGKEKFMPYQYEQIQSQTKKRTQPPSTNVEPMYLNRHYVTSGRIKKCETQSILIKVWPNGGDLKGPRRVLLTPRVRPFTLQNVVASVNEILKEDLLGTVERLYFLTGVQVSDIDQITHNGQYVACKKTEKFKRTRYNEHGVKNLSTSPRLERKLLAPLFPRSNYSLSQSSPDQSNESTQSSVNSHSHRLRAPGDEHVHPIRPLKYGSPDRTHMSNLDRDQSGVPKSSWAAHPARPGQDIHTKLGHPGLTENGHPPGRPPYRRSQYPADGRPNPYQHPDRTPNGYHGYKTNKEHRSPKPPETPQQSKISHSSDRLIEMDNAATKIQAAYRGHQTREHLRSPKPPAVDRQERRYTDSQLIEVDNAASKIQAAYRGYLSRKEPNQPKSPAGARKNTKHPSEDTSTEVEQAVTKIQAAYRGHQTRRKFKSSKNQSEYDVEKNRAASKIQAGYRGYQERKSRWVTNERSQEKAAAIIQAGYRGYQTRKQLSSKQSTKDEEMAAAKIQAGIRGYQTRKHLSYKIAAATKIQSSYRGHMTRKNMRSSKDKKHKAAAKIQAGYRGYVARKQFARPSLAHTNGYDGFDKMNDAALTIQSHYRGYRTRQELGRRQTEEHSEDMYWP